MMMKRLLVIVASVFVLAGCHDMTTELEDALGKKCWSDILYWEDVSKKTFSFTGNNRFTMTTDGGETAIKVSSGSGNWVLSSLGFDIKGYEVQIKCDSSSNIAGLQLFSQSDYRAYEVFITKDGKIDVRFQDKATKDTYLFKSAKIIDDITVYNTISLVLQDDRSLKVYCNGQYVYTIKGYSIKFGKLAMQMNSSGNTYYKIKRVMH